MQEIAACFGGNLILCRKRSGLSQEQLALRASLHRTEISMLERGERLARIDTLLKLSAALAVPAESLLAGIVWEPGSWEAGRFAPRPTPAPLADPDEKSH